MVFLSIVAIIIAIYIWHKRKYGVWLKTKEGKAVLGYGKTNTFGVKIASFGSIVDRDWCELLPDGKVGKCSSTYTYHVVEWKPYKNFK